MTQEGVGTLIPKDDSPMDGANLADISRVAGHKGFKTTLGYVHTADERLHQAVANLPKIQTL